MSAQAGRSAFQRGVLRLAHIFEAAVGMTPAQHLVRLKTVVEHISDTWTQVLRRRAYMQALGRSRELHDALARTYAAHVHNAVQDVLINDLIREMGALILDRNQDSASVASAMETLRDESVLAELQKDYRAIVPVQMYDSEKFDDRMRATVNQMYEDAELRRNLDEFAMLKAQLAVIDKAVLTGGVGALLWTARSRSVAHYDVVRNGSDWKLWRVEGTGLTYGQLDEYVDACTGAIHTLALLVQRTHNDFPEASAIGNQYAAEYIDALVRGLKMQKQVESAQRQTTNFD
jgi:hypothetical protein